MNIPASVIRPFEPHGLPMILIGAKAIELLVLAITKSVISFRLNGMTILDLTEDNINKLENCVRNELNIAKLPTASVNLVLAKKNTELHCYIFYSLAGKPHAVTAGWELFE